MEQQENLEYQNKVRTCWQILTPLADKALRILGPDETHWLASSRKINRLINLRKRATDLIRTFPKNPQEPHWIVLRELEDRATPPGAEEVLNMFNHLRSVVANSTVDYLEKQCDLTSAKSMCSIILRAVAALQCETSPPQPGWPAPAGGTGLPVSDGEIDSLEEQIKKMEERQQEIDHAVRERSEAEQQQAKREAERQRQERSEPGAREEADSAPQPRKDNTAANTAAKEKAAKEAKVRTVPRRDLHRKYLTLKLELNPESEKELQKQTATRACVKETVFKAWLRGLLTDDAPNSRKITNYLKQQIKILSSRKK
jgi:hypothetical protein